MRKKQENCWQQMRPAFKSQVSVSSLRQKLVRPLHCVMLWWLCIHQTSASPLHVAVSTHRH